MTSVFTMATMLNQSTTTMTSANTTAAYDVWTWYGATLVLLPLLMVVGVPGNILVLLVYSWRFPASTFREFVRVLAWLDLACNLVAMPLNLTHAILTAGSPHLLRITAAARYVSYTSIFASAFVLLVIAVDRYLKICQPQRTGITIVHARLLCVLAVLSAFLINIPAWFIDFESVGTDVMAIVHSALAGFFFLTFTLSMVVLYSLVWHRLRSHARSMRKSSSGGEAVSAVESANRHALRTSKVFSALTVLFFLSILPHFLLFIITSVEPNVWKGLTPLSSVFEDLATQSPFINCVANPFVYSFTSPRFRKEFWVVLQGLKPGARLSTRPTVTASCSDHAPRIPASNWSSRETSEERLDASVQLSAISRLHARDASSLSSSEAAAVREQLVDVGDQ